MITPHQSNDAMIADIKLTIFERFRTTPYFCSEQISN